jgi:predicted CXXCH cytochrome family protein
MFRKLAGLTAIAGLFIAGTAFAQTGITDSVHDFRTELTTSELCGFCHTPHQSDPNVSDAPLWDHALSTEAGYDPYTSGTMNTTMSGDVTTWGISRLCISCHDGVTATGSTTMRDIPAWALKGAAYSNIDRNLKQEHPVSVSATPDADVRTTPLNAATRLFSTNVECASCHDVHRGTAQPNLLVMDNTGSAMCLSCHDK